MEIYSRIIYRVRSECQFTLFLAAALYRWNPGKSSLTPGIINQERDPIFPLVSTNNANLDGLNLEHESAQSRMSHRQQHIP